MTLLWAVMAVMALTGALLVVVPVLKHRARVELSGVTVNSLVYRDRLQELESDLRDGRVDADEFAQLKNELELTLLDDVALSQKDQAHRSLAGKWLVWPLLVIIPLAAFGLYWKEGYRPEIRDWMSSQQRMERILPLVMAGDFGALEREGVQLPELVRALQTRLQKNPGDARGWYLLGVSYMQVRMPQQAETAFSRALNLDGNNVDYLLGYTQASVALNNGEISPEIRNTLMRIIQQQPDNPKPYMTLGMAAFQSGNFADAISIWQGYMQRENADPGAVQLLQRSIEVAQKQLQQAPAIAEGSATPDTGGPSLQVTVNVTDEVRAQLSANDILFVYARAVKGPPMPLAVVRQAVGNWPVVAELSDANAMTPQATLSKFDEVIVQARISPSGNAIPQSGDWFGPTQVIKLQPGMQAVTLQISGRMP